MRRQRYQRVREVFHRVCDEPPSRRARLLEEACGSDAELRGHVEQLLEAETRNPDLLQSPPPPEVPERVGRYRIVRLIGEGGMGIVYEARQDDPRRRVALKVIRPGMVTRGLLRRFRYEAQVLGQLQHPGIAQIYEAGTSGEQPFFAMELVEGAPLLSYAETRRPGVRERLELIARVCDALHHAHQKGVIHRDLKPANILVTAEGQPKVLDFGVARATDADVQTVTLHTGPGQLVGTVPYMSPEQAAGDPAGIDVRSDVYALGVIACELLTGRLPYPVAGKLVHEAVRVIREEEPLRLSSVNRALRGDAETIIGRALAKEKSRRYQSASELAADIRASLAGRPIAARPTSAFYQLRKFARRNKAFVTATAVVFIALLGSTIFSLHQAGVAQRREQDALRQAYRASVAAATAALATDDPVTARAQLMTTDERLRNWEWRYLDSRRDESIAMIVAGEPIMGAGINADASVAVAVSPDGAVRWWDAFTGERIASANLGVGDVADAAFSADATRLAVIGGRDGATVAICDVTADHALINVARRTLGEPGNRVAVSPDGRRVAAEAARRIRVWDAAGDRRAAWRVPAERILALSFSRNGERLAAAMNLGLGNSGVATYVADTGVRVSSATHTRDGQSVALSPDGSLTATGGLDKAIRLRDTGGARVLRTLNGHTDVPAEFDFDEAGARLVSGADDQTIRLWDVESGESINVYCGHTDDVRSVRFSADDSRILSTGADGTLRVWSVRPDHRTTVLEGHSSYVYAVAFSADGDHLFSGGWDGDVRMWDAAGGACLAVIPTGAKVYDVAASPDGRFIATSSYSRIKLWDASTLTGIRSFPARAAHVHSIAFGSSGARLVGLGRGGRAVVRDLPSGEVILQTDGPPATQVALSPDGRRIATSHEDGVRVWSATTGDRITRLGGVRAPASITWSRDGSRLAAGLANGHVALWNALAGEDLRELPGHSGVVYALTFSPDGTRLASGSNDTSIRLWDIATGEPVAKLDGHEDYVYSLAFSPDGSRLASGSGDSTVRIWDTRPVHVRRRARARLRRLADEVRPQIRDLYVTLDDPAEVTAAIAADPDLREPARRAALLAALDLREDP